ncbi:Isopropylmalate dehydrogenase [Penicillium griseofulvum]|uniref:3-isopropylmalate dehydrogenase n=1 Tax=Penicillium patulum TaxID=5078 RepID=A0A135LWC9_PENPA|nr:Isopropylmalate dehydrogenase [Penicillium griseofulvum]KXG53278.1 Isopropylmalate dehydrogenase [Penicillium griseofulvum]
MAKNFNILVLPGDGIGPEVMAEAVKVLKTFETPERKFELRQELIGGCSIDAHGKPVTEEVKQAALDSDAVLFAAVGGPKWDNQRRGLDGPEGGLLQLRKAMDIYANLRPCSSTSPSASIAKEFSPFKHEIIEGVDFVVVRENCGGAYFGRKVEEETYAMDEWGYSEAEIQRVTRLSAEVALRHNPPWPVISLDKANVLASSRLWRRVVDKTMAAEYPQVKLVHQLADSASLILATNPRSLNGVILADNTFGDMISDQAGSIVGTLGVLPSASLNGLPGDKTMKTRPYGLYEPTHGSAPTIAGQNIANPVAMILCVALMFRYSLSMEDEARRVEDAVRKVLDSGIRTPDLGDTSVLLPSFLSMSEIPPLKPRASTPSQSPPDESPTRSRALNMSSQTPNIPSTPATALYHPTRLPNTPGSCALRLENLEQQTSATKSELMASIAADICATFISIAKYSEDGTLHAQHTGVIDMVIQTIRDTDVKQRHLLDRQVRRLRKEKKWIRKKYSRLAGQADGLGRTYQTKARKLKIALREAQGEVMRLQNERDMLQAFLKNRGYALNDNVDGKGEEVDGEYELAEEDETANDEDL